MKKVTVVFKSVNVSSLLAASYILGTYRGDENEITIINLSLLDAQGIYDAIEGIKENQDYVYVCAEQGDDLNEANILALIAKVKAETGIYREYTYGNGTTVAGMSCQVWRTFNNAKVSYPMVIHYLDNLEASLTEEEVYYRMYMAAALKSRYNLVDMNAGTITFDIANLDKIVGLMDKGIFDAQINSSAVSNLKQPVQDKLLLHELMVIGADMMNGLYVQFLIDAADIDIDADIDVDTDTDTDTDVDVDVDVE